MEKDQFIVASILRKEIVDLEKQKEEVLEIIQRKRPAVFFAYEYVTTVWGWKKNERIRFELSSKILQNVLQQIERDIEEKTKQFNEL